MHEALLASHTCGVGIGISFYQREDERECWWLRVQRWLRILFYFFSYRYYSFNKLCNGG